MAGSEILVVAGEASGDQHAAELVAQLQARRPELHFFGMGGQKLAARFVDRLYDAREINVMGITEVLPKLRRILRVLEGLAAAAERRRPACAILVDIPDFNLRLARRLRRLGIPVVYYVSPSVWAWRRGRVDTLGANVDQMLCILPFEEAFYARHGVPARYVGSPVLDQVPAPAPAAVFRQRLGVEADRPTLALLPGSRHRELSSLLPVLLASAAQLQRQRPGLQCLLPLAPGVDRAAVEAAGRAAGLELHAFDGRAPEVVGASDVALVASGTATLEAALMERPMVVVYRLAPVTYAVARLLVKVPHFALPNLLLGERVVPELLQGDVTPARICAEVARLTGPDQAATVAALRRLRPVLGPPGAASRAADAVLHVLDAPAKSR